MSESDSTVYEKLANCYAQQGEARQRDHCLVLAADAALNAGQTDRAEQVRQRLLTVNPNHWLRPFDSMRDAMQSNDVRDLLADLRRQWPPESARKLLRQRDVVETTPVRSEPRSMGAPVAAPVYEMAPVMEKKPAKVTPALDEDAPTEPTAVGTFIATLVFLMGVALAAGVLFVAIGWPFLKMFV